MDGGYRDVPEGSVWEIVVEDWKVRTGWTPVL